MIRRRPPAATKAPVPAWVRHALIGGAILLVVAAAVVNISHTRQNAHDLGQDILTVTVVGFLPDVGLPLSFLRLRYYPRSVWGWAGIAVSIGLIAWSALVSTKPEYGISGHVMSLVCLTFAIIAAGQAHVPAAEPVDVLIAHVEALADDAVRDADRSRAEAHAEARAVRADAARDTARAAEEARTERARAAAAEAELDHVRQTHAAELNALRAAHEATSEAPAQERPVAARQAHAGRRTPPAARRTAQANTPDDLAVRRRIREQWNAREDHGRRTPNAAIARTLGIEMGPARALVSRWKRERTTALAERAQDAHEAADTTTARQAAGGTD